MLMSGLRACLRDEMPMAMACFKVSFPFSVLSLPPSVRALEFGRIFEVSCLYSRCSGSRWNPTLACFACDSMRSGSELSSDREFHDSELGSEHAATLRTSFVFTSLYRWPARLGDVQGVPAPTILHAPGSHRRSVESDTRGYARTAGRLQLISKGVPN